MPTEHFDTQLCFIHIPKGKELTLPALRTLVQKRCASQFGGVPGPENPAGIHRIAVVVYRQALLHPEDVEVGPVDFMAGDQAMLAHEEQDWLATRGLKELDLLLRKKIAADQIHKREAGHVSTHPGPNFVTEDTVVFFMGSIGFLLLAAFAVLEWRDKHQLLQCLLQITHLEAASQQKKPRISYPSFFVKGKEMWPGYSNSMLATATELSGRIPAGELLGRLAQKEKE